MKSQEVYPWRGSTAQVKVTIPKNPNGPLRWCRWIDAGGIVQYCHYGGPWHVHKYSRQTGDIYFKVEIIHFTSSKIALYSACRKQDLAAVIASVTCSGTSPEYIALSKHECASGAGGKYLGYKKYLCYPSSPCLTKPHDNQQRSYFLSRLPALAFSFFSLLTTHCFLFCLPSC